MSMARDKDTLDCIRDDLKDMNLDEESIECVLDEILNGNGVTINATYIPPMNYMVSNQPNMNPQQIEDFKNENQ